MLILNNNLFILEKKNYVRVVEHQSIAMQIKLVKNWSQMRYRIQTTDTHRHVLLYVRNSDQLFVRTMKIVCLTNNCDRNLICLSIDTFEDLSE